jgi:transposase InsO family protein
MDLKIDIIQTDNGSEFCKYFDKECEELNIKHVWTYPHTPKMN